MIYAFAKPAQMKSNLPTSTAIQDIRMEIFIARNAERLRSESGGAQIQIAPRKLKRLADQKTLKNQEQGLGNGTKKTGSVTSLIWHTGESILAMTLHLQSLSPHLESRLLNTTKCWSLSLSPVLFAGSIQSKTANG
jgi:hypothetical protein